MRLLPKKVSVKSYFLGEVLASSLVEALTLENNSIGRIDTLHIMVTACWRQFGLIEGLVYLLDAVTERTEIIVIRHFYLP